VVAWIQFECWLRELVQELSSVGTIIFRIGIHNDKYGVSIDEDVLGFVRSEEIK
jgi:hypothetical protein